MGAFELQKNLLLSELRSKEAKNTNKPVLSHFTCALWVYGAERRGWGQDSV